MGRALKRAVATEVAEWHPLGLRRASRCAIPETAAVRGTASIPAIDGRTPPS